MIGFLLTLVIIAAVGGCAAIQSASFASRRVRVRSVPELRNRESLHDGE